KTSLSVVRRRYETRRQQCGVYGAAIGAIARGVESSAYWPVKPHGFCRVILARIEEAALQPLVVLRLNPVESEAVIKSQFPVDFPVVLQIPLDVGRTILALIDADCRLVQVVKEPEQRIRVRMTGVVRIVRVVAEHDAHRVARRLILAAALYINTGF